MVLESSKVPFSEEGHAFCNLSRERISAVVVRAIG
jgi:hypothetical protein